MQKWIKVAFIIFLGGILSPAIGQPEWIRQSFGNRNFADIHEDANAVCLYDVGNIEIDDDKTAQIRIQVAFKVLTEAGTHRGTLILPSSNTVEIDDIRGWHKKPKQKLKELEDDMIIEAGFQHSAAYFDESRQYIASFPNVEPGDFVAFEATISEEDWTSCYQSFTFHTQQPVLYTKYTITIPDGWKLAASEWNMEDIKKQKTGNRYTWVSRDLPYKKRESYKPSWGYLSKRISLVSYNPDEQSPTQFNSWENVANWCANVYDKRADVSPEIDEKVKTLLKDATSDDDKLRRIAGFVQDNIRYVAIEVGKGRWQPRTASATYYNGYGDCKDKSTLMRAMLKSAGISSIPALINATNRVDRDLPTPFQFNHVIVGIPVKDLNLSNSFDNAIVDEWMFFDPTDPEVQIGEIPHNLQGHFVVMGSHGDSISYVLPYSKPESYSRDYRLHGKILSDGSYSADIIITSYNGWASEDRYYFQNNTKEEQKEKLYRKLSQNLPSVKIAGYTFTDFQDSLRITFTITGKDIIYHTKENMILHPDIFSQSLHRPLTAEERKYPIWFGGTKMEEKTIFWKYPDTWIPEVGLNQIRNECDGASILLDCSVENHQINLRSTYKKTGYLMDVQLYPQAREFSSSLQQAQGKMILFSR